MGVKGAKNFLVTVNGTNLTAYLDEAEVQMAVAELETTNLDSTGQEFVPGLPNYQASLAITRWDKIVDDVLGPLAITPSLVTTIITAKDASGDTLTYTWTSKSFVTGYNIAGSATGKVTSAPTLRLSGVPTRTTS